MSSYTALSDWYDSLTEDVGYEELYAYLREMIRREGVEVHSCMDMACGTGSLSFLFAADGVRTLGVDLSEGMLARAKEKAASIANAPVFMQGNMADFVPDEQVDLIVCMLDSFNYLTDPEDGLQALSCFYEGLNPGGMLVFDVRPPHQLEAFDGQMFMDETDDVVCIWRTEYDPEERQCFYGMDIFSREGELWRRTREEHLEYAYDLEQLKWGLLAQGFDRVEMYGDRSFESPKEDEERVFIMARKDLE